MSVDNKTSGSQSFVNRLVRYIEFLTKCSQSITGSMSHDHDLQIRDTN